MIDEIGVMLLKDEHDPVALHAAAARVAERAMFYEWYAIRIGNLVVVIPKEEEHEDA